MKTLTITCITLALLSTAFRLSAAEQPIVLYDNTLTAEGDSAYKVWPNPGDEFEAQQFYTGEADNVSAITIGLNRFGAPGGELVFEIWSVDEDTGNPGEIIDEFGRVDLDSLKEVNRDALPAYLDMVRIEGSVTGLKPNTHYYLVSQQEGVRLVRNEASYVWSIYRPDDDAHLSDLEDALVVIPGQWVSIASLVGQPSGMKIYAKIEAACPKPLQVEIDHAVAVTWDSQLNTVYQIQMSNDMETWEVAIDAIQGTGERMMQAFVREETEVFYRVEVLE